MAATGGGRRSVHSDGGLRAHRRAPMVFMSYRRGDTGGYAAHLADNLVHHYGEENVFRDVDSISPGEDFYAKIRAEVESCDVALVLIGKGWLSAVDDDGGRRLDNPRDFVRLEIEAALTKQVPIIPVLFQGARMPREEELPDAIRDLSRRNALDIPDSLDGRARAVEKLMDSIVRTMSPPAEALTASQRGEPSTDIPSERLAGKLRVAKEAFSTRSPLVSDIGHPDGDVSPASVYCRRCGKQRLDDSKFCNRCGTPHFQRG